MLRFTPWWLRGEEALALAFFRELQGALIPSLGEKAKKLLPKIGALLLRGGGLVGSVLDVTAGGGGAVASKAMAYLEGLIDTEESLEALHQELRTALAEQPNRFLVVIDNIDRLTPDEALLLFKLVKSVGQLPNVLYLLACDRTLAEEIVKERFPSEGPHFLEKIVQAVFEVPEPGANALRAQLQAELTEVCGLSFDEASVEFFNIFLDVVEPEIAKPRDLVRYTNMVAFSWPAVAGEVHPGDFLALEALRLFDPQVYRAIRVNKALVCGPPGYHQLLDEPLEAYDRAFLKGCPEDRIEQRKRILRRLFPPIESAWENVHYGADARSIWARERRACSQRHFETYFRFAVSGEVLSKSELKQLISRAGESGFLQRALLEAVAQQRSDGSTKASLVLEELTLHAAEISSDAIGKVVSTLLRFSDELDVSADDANPFKYGDNAIRIHWLIRALTIDRLQPAQRSSLLLSAAGEAALSTLIRFADRVWREHHRDEGDKQLALNGRLMVATDAETCRKMALERLADAADGELVQKRGLLKLLYRWFNLADDGGAAAKSWATAQLDDDRSVARLAAAFTTVSSSQSGDGMVSVNKTGVQTKGLKELIDAPRLHTRCEELAGRSDMPPDDERAIAEFLEAWRETEAAEGADAFQ